MAALLDACRTLSCSGLEDGDVEAIVARASPWSHDLRGARVLVTGATGWFGTWLLDALVALDRELAWDLRIVAVSRDPARFARRHPALASSDAIEWIAADVRRERAIAMDGVTHVVHAATDTGVPGDASAARELFDTIVLGTHNVLDAAARAGARRVLLVSSGAVYGPQPSDVERLDETSRGAPDATDPRNAYAEGKRAAEQLAALHHANGLDTVIARCFAFVGPHMPLDAHFAIGNFIGDALAGRTIVVKGDGRTTRGYLYMSDLVVWLLTMLVEGRPMRPYNVGGDEAVSIETLARRCAVAGRVAVDVRIEGSTKGGPSYVPSTERARNELGLEASVSLDDAIVRTMRWCARTGC